MKTIANQSEHDEIILSLLIPAYNYSEGIERILRSLTSSNKALSDRFEIIVFDNSKDDSLANELKKYSGIIREIKYKHHLPMLGPCGNWNELIKAARGRYYILMHHDEFPVTENFILGVIEELSEHPDADLVLMDCLLMDKGSGLFRRHVPSWIRVLTVKYFPAYLFRRNVIGPTASLVVRKELHDRFDCEVIWLIDVDEYYRLILKAKRWYFAKQLKIASYIDRGNSITSSLGDDIGEIRQKELKYLSQKYPEPSLWLNENRWVSILEKIFWSAMRVVTRSYSFVVNKFGFYPVGKKTVRKAFSDYK